MLERKEDSQQGLSTLQVQALQAKWGKNELVQQKKETIFHKILHVVHEPMFLLLLVASLIYFILGEPKDGAIMLVFVVGIISIETIQERKTDKTLKALKDLSAPRIEVRRDGRRQVIDSSELVPGDVLFLAEGSKIPADGSVLEASTLRVDESSLTGEAEGVWKITEGSSTDSQTHWRRDYCYAGTLVTQGRGTILVDKIGAVTEYGKIGKAVTSAPHDLTPLQRQTGKLVKVCAGIAVALFMLIAIVTYFNLPDHAFSDRIIESILAGITLAMAMIPEEFPVILTVFLSMGAWRLGQKQSLVRKLAAVETLGAVSVLCVDKTGTITCNEMQVEASWSLRGDIKILQQIMGMGCEPDAYDPMEKAMVAHCEAQGITRDILFGGKLIKEYPFTDEAKMMGHVWQKGDQIIVAAKGSPERILTICKMTAAEQRLAENKSKEMSSQGLRVIAVGRMVLPEENAVPAELGACQLEFCGLVGLADPPRASVKQDIATCVKAGIRVVMITGDNGITARAIAEKIGMPGSAAIITGDAIDEMEDSELREKVKVVRIFSRVIPAHKMRIVQAFKANGEIVAMTGDGVNDAPALKYADIGIAMGKRGSEVSREAADLVLLDDNFSTIVDTIKDGRRIYDNIKKAVGYVFTIHIPIALAALLAPILAISPADLLLFPIHVVLLELVIDPTCSIVLERQPAEADIMERPPRDTQASLLPLASLCKSILQGLAIFAASFGTYLLFLNLYPSDAPTARTMGLSIMLLANILLVQVNTSATEPVLQSMTSLMHDKVMRFAAFGTLAVLGIMLYTPLHTFLKLAPLSLGQLLSAAGLAGSAVLWYELVKFRKRVG